MTELRKHIIDSLLIGGYLVSWKNHRGTYCFRLYNQSGNPERNVRSATIKKLDRFIDPKIKIWKTDKAGRITLNLASVRKLHGRSYIKQQYNNIKNSK